MAVIDYDKEQSLDKYQTSRSTDVTDDIVFETGHKGTISRAPPLTAGRPVIAAITIGFIKTDSATTAPHRRHRD